MMMLLMSKKAIMSFCLQFFTNTYGLFYISNYTYPDLILQQVCFPCWSLVVSNVQETLVLAVKIHITPPVTVHSKTKLT